MLRLKALFLFSILFCLTISCGGGGGGGSNPPPPPPDPIPDMYHGNYRCLSCLPSAGTLSVTATAITWSGSCRTQYSVTRIEGNRIFYKVTESNCQGRSVGWEGWSDVAIIGTTLTWRDQDGAPGIYARSPASPPAGQLLGNFRFNYTLENIWEDQYVINRATGDYNSEGSEYYSGYKLGYKNVTLILAAWLPSLSAYFAMAGVINYDAMYQVFVFTVGDSGQLAGCYYQYYPSSETLSSCYALNQASRRYNLGSWAREAELLTEKEGTLEQAVTRLAAQAAEVDNVGLSRGKSRSGFFAEDDDMRNATDADPALQNSIDAFIQRMAE